jgi:hypothetical protein
MFYVVVHFFGEEPLIVKTDMVSDLIARLVRCYQGLYESIEIAEVA